DQGLFLLQRIADAVLGARAGRRGVKPLGAVLVGCLVAFGAFIHTRRGILALVAQRRVGLRLRHVARGLDIAASLDAAAAEKTGLVLARGNGPLRRDAGAAVAIVDFLGAGGRP